MIARALQRVASQPQSIISDLCLFPKNVGVEDCCGSRKVIIFKADAGMEQLCQRAGLTTCKTRFDIGDDIFGRQLAVAGHFAKLSKRLLLGLLCRTTGNKEHRKQKNGDAEVDKLMKHIRRNS